MKKTSVRIQLLMITLMLFGLIVIMGVISVTQVQNISKKLDGLMAANYQSIKTLSAMLSITDRQNAEMLDFLIGDTEDSANNFMSDIDSFHENFYIEANNITEKDEDKYVSQINLLYSDYTKKFQVLTDTYNQEGRDAAYTYYNNDVVPVFTSLQQNIIAAKDLNETAMLNGKLKTKNEAQQSLYLLVCVSLAISALSFIMALYFSKKISKPIETLTYAVKNYKFNNDMGGISIDSGSEIGELADEFNSLMVRLNEFEHSTQGQLLNEKNKSMAIIKSISEPLIVLDEEYRIQLVNKACESIFKIDENNVTDKHFLEMIPLGEVFKFISSQDKNSGDFIVSLPVDGQPQYFRILCTSLSMGSVVVFQNVTHLKELEQLKSDFFSSISHELKTPLTSIIMGSGLLLKHKSDNPITNDIISAINEDAALLNKLINDMLELSRMESGKSLFKFGPASIANLIETSVKANKLHAEDSGIEIVQNIEENLPSVHVDSEKMVWVFNNLIDNAIKYSGEGKQIFVSARQHENRIEIDIADNGIGIPPQYISRVFDKFMRIDETETSVRGSGIGLAIVKEIIEKHQGSVSCSSAENKGTIFQITLYAQPDLE